MPRRTVTSVARSACTASSSRPGRAARRRPQRLDTRRRALARRGPDRASSASTSTPRPSASSTEKHTARATATAVRAEVLDIVADARQDAEPGDRLRRHARRHRRGGRARSRRSAWRSGDRVATLVSLTLTPLVITDGLARWDGRSEQVPGEGHAILFGRSIAAVLPDDLPPDAGPDGDGRLRRPGAHRPGGGASTSRAAGRPTVAVIGGAGKSGSLSLAAARGRRRRPHASASCPPRRRPTLLAGSRPGRRGRHRRRPRPGRPLATPSAAAGGPADVTVVCVDVPGCEQRRDPGHRRGRHGHLLLDGHLLRAPPRSAPRGWPPTCAMLVGNGYVPGHAAYALDLLRRNARCGRSSRAAWRSTPANASSCPWPSPTTGPWVRHPA